MARKDGQPLPGEDEPLHAYVTAHNLDAVKKAVEKIKEVITAGINVPEGQNDLRWECVLCSGVSFRRMHRF